MSLSLAILTKVIYFCIYLGNSHVKFQLPSTNLRNLSKLLISCQGMKPNK
jgi:hypothetical protein